MSKYKFTIINEYQKDENTLYGLSSINNIFVKPEDFEQIIVEIISDWKNLEFVFQTSFDETNKINAIERFLPSKKPDDLDTYIDTALSAHKGFYSFLAECLEAVLLRDVFAYHLSKAIIDISDTLISQRNGVDVCMVDIENRIMVLGEAKFRKNISDALKDIADDLANTESNSLYNKIDNLFRTIKTDSISKEVLLEIIGSNDILNIDIDDFIKYDFLFVGFSLHENHLKNVIKYTEPEYYDFWKPSVDSVINNIIHIFSKAPGKYNLSIFHLPVSSKKELIKKIIEKFYEMREK